MTSIYLYSHKVFKCLLFQGRLGLCGKEVSQKEFNPLGPLQDQKSLDWTKFKAFADNK